MKKKIIAYIKSKYQVSPEYFKTSNDNCAIFKHKDNQNWFALMVLGVIPEKLGVPGTEWVDIMNLKIRKMPISKEDAQVILPAYHMNPAHWRSILLDGTLPIERIYEMIDFSYLITASAETKRRLAGGK